MSLLLIPIFEGKSSAEESPRAPFNRGIEWLRKEDLKAEADVQAILKSDPENPLAYFDLGKRFSAMRRIDLALTAFNRAVELKPDFVEAHIRLGEIYEGQGNLGEALREYEEAYLYMTGEDPSEETRILARIGNLENAVDLREKLQRGIVLLRRGGYTEAEGTFREVIAMQPENAQAHNFLGVVLGIQNRFDEAIESFKKSLVISPGLMDSRNRLVELYQIKGDLDAARSELEKAILLLEDKEGPEAHSLESRLNALEDQIEMKTIFDRINKEIEEKNFDSALASLQAVLRRDSKQPTANFILGNLWADRQRYDLAETNFKAVLEQNPNSTDTYLRLAQVYERTRFLGRAKTQYEKALATPAGKEEPLRQQIQQALIRLEEGRRQLQEAAEEPAAEGRKAIQEGDLTKAILFLERATQITPDNPGLHFELGELYERNGQIDLAINQMRGALEFDQTLGAAYQKLGLLYEKKRNFYQARRELNRAPLIDPSREIIDRIDRQIAEVEKESLPLMERAGQEEEEERVTAAIETLKKALIIAPDDLRLRMRLGTLYTKAGLGLEAFNEFNLILGGDPGNGEAEYHLGQLYASARQWVDALPKYELALQSKRLPAELREKAAAELQRVKDKIKDDEAIRRYAARAARRLAEEDYLASAENFSKVNALAPDDVFSLYRTGVAYESLRKWDDAARYYREVLSGRPTDVLRVLAYQRLGFVYEALGKNEEAIRTYRSGLEAALDPDASEVRGIKDRLTPLEDRTSIFINQVILSYQSNPTQSAVSTGSSLVSNLSLTLTYHLVKDQDFNIPLELATRNTFYFRFNNFFSSESLSLTVNSNKDPYSISFGYRLVAGLSDVSGLTGYNNVGFLNVDRRVGNSSKIGFGYTYDYLWARVATDDVIRQGVRISFDQSWDINTLFLSYNFSNNDFKLSDLANVSNGIAVTYRTILFETITGTISYSVDYKQYVNPDAFNSSEERAVFRRNILHNFSLSGLYPFSSNFNLVVVYGETLNNSNLPAFAGGSNPVARLSGQAESLGDFRDRSISFTLNWNF